MKKILLTGSHGYIGRNFQHYMRFNDEFEISCCDLKNGKDCRNLTHGDIIDYGVDIIVHLAANINIKDMETDPKLSIANVDSTRNICNIVNDLEADGKTVRVIFASSCQALVCKNLYGLTKFAEEAIIEDKCRSRAILRFFNVVGGDIIDDSNNDHILPNLFNCVVNKTPFKIYGDPTQKRSYIHVNRICEAIKNELNTCANEVKHLVTEDVLSIEKVAQMVDVSTGSTLKVEKIDARKGDYPEIIIPNGAMKYPVGDMAHAINDFRRHFKV